MPFRVLIVILATSASACSLSRGTLGGDGGGGALDAHVETIDTGPRPDGNLPDTGVPEDAWHAEDASMPVDASDPADAYAELPDAYVELPDAFVPPVDAHVRPTCTEAYGRAMNYVRCSAEDAEQCAFYVRLSGSSCNAFCGDDACVQGFENGGPADRCAGGSTPFGCEATTTDQICICDRPL